MSGPRDIEPRAEPAGPADPWSVTTGGRSLEVEAAPLARRRRVPDRAIVGAAVVLACLGLAVLKPWQSPTATVVMPSTSPSAVPPPAIAPVAAPITLPEWSSLAAALPPRPAWGLRVLTDRGAPGSTSSEGGPIDRPDQAVVSARSAMSVTEHVALVERWYPVETDWPGRRPLWQARAGLSWAVRVPAPASPVRLLALTSPPMSAPLDVRVWRVTTGGLERLEVDRPDGDVGLGDWFLAPPPANGVPQAAWPGGWFRIEVLTAGGIERLSLRIDAGPATPAVWPPASWPFVSPLLPRPIPVPSIVEPRDRGRDAQPDRPEAFLAIGSEVVGVSVRVGEPLTARGAWLATRAGDGPDPVPSVAMARSSLVTGFGLRFPAGASEPTLEVVSLVDRRMRPREADQIGWQRGRSGDAAWAVVDAPDSRPWVPGVYRIDASWRDGDGRRQQASYHVDVLPGGLRSAPALLGASRRWASLGGGSGVVAGTYAPFQVRSAGGLRLVEQVAATSPTFAAALDPECLVGTDLGGTRLPIGVMTSGTAAIQAVEVTEIQAYARPRPVDVRAALEPVPGLVVLGPEDPAGWSSGRYAVTLRSDDASLAYGFCVE